MLNKAEQRGELTGISFSDQGPAIHHLFFADDSLFLCKANVEEAKVLMEILSSYEKLTGQKVNPSKSAITFGKNVGEECREEIKETLQIVNEGGEGLYLGLPEAFNGYKIQLFSFLEDKLDGKISGWFAKALSLGGKEVLLKAVGFSLPVHAMSCFLLPKTTIQHLNSAMADFWWDAQENKRKMHWVSWEKVCLPKELGGMGFKDLEAFNLALLAKQAWRILSEPESLFAKLFKSRYFPDCHFLQALPGSRPSFGWTSILAGRDILEPGISKRVGNGKSFNVWLDEWIEVEEGVFKAPLRKQNHFILGLRVSDLIDFRKRDWDYAKLEFHFLPQDIALIKRRKPIVSREDFWTWDRTKKGAYTVHSGYKVAYEEKNFELIHEVSALPSLNPLKEKVWKLKSLPKIKAFLWRVLSGAVATADQLERRGMKVDARCQICGEEGETINHALFNCPFARQVWALSDIPSPKFGYEAGSIYSNVNHLLNLPPHPNLRSF